jgi:hypothetical protein
MAHMPLPELDRLATIRRGAEVPDYTDAGKKEEALPKRIKPSPSSLSESSGPRDSKITRRELRRIIKEQAMDIDTGGPRVTGPSSIDDLEKDQVLPLPDINGRISIAIKDGRDRAMKIGLRAVGKYDVNIRVDSSSIVSITPTGGNTIDETPTEEISKSLKYAVRRDVASGDIKLNTEYNFTATLSAG